MRGTIGLLLAVMVMAIPTASAEETYVIVNRGQADPPIVQATGDALQRCIPFYAHALNMTPEKIDVYLAPSRQAFAQALQTRGSYPAAAAAGWANTAHVVPSNSNASLLFVSEEAMRDLTTQQVVESICIGVGTILERQLGGARRVSGHHWLRQGYSAFMAASALDAFKLRSLAATRDNISRALAQIRRENRPFPTLAATRTLDGWQKVFQDYGATEAEAFVFAAVDLLTSKSGPQAFGPYFKGLGYRDRLPNIDDLFQTAFTLSLDQFQAELDTYLAAQAK